LPFSHDVRLSVCAPPSFPSRPAAYWGLVSSVFATLALCLFIYLYVAKVVRRQPPSGTALIVVGIVSSLGIGAGVGGFSVYLGLGIIHTLEGDGQWCVQCLSRSLHSTFLCSLPSYLPLSLPPPLSRSSSFSNRVHSVCVVIHDIEVGGNLICLHHQVITLTFNPAHC